MNFVNDEIDILFILGADRGRKNPCHQPAPPRNGETVPLIPQPDAKKQAFSLDVIRARAALDRKKKKTPLEDALLAQGGARAVRLVQWARKQRDDYNASLVLWRSNRLQWAQEAQDIFDHRARARREHHENHDTTDVFQMQNDSINIVASLAEFAAAQAEQDIYGGDPWFSASPVGNNDAKLAEDIQHHLQWTFRDGRFVDAQCQGIDRAVALGECFTKMVYAIDTDEYESVVPCLHVNGKPVMDANEQYVTTDAQAQLVDIPEGAKIDWKEAYKTNQTVIRQGVEAIPIHFNDISFREDAPELDLRYTNVYLSVEMSVFEAMRRFNLSKEDAIRLARCADARQHTERELQRERMVDAAVVNRVMEDEPLGFEESERLLNTRVRLTEGYIRADATGEGKEARMCIVFPPMQEDWIIWADYLANISPKSELPIKCDVWEPIPHRLYGRGFFSKYAYLQTGSDSLWNQVNFRNGMHANPLTAIHEENISRDDDTADFVIGPGTTIRPKAGKLLRDCVEFAQMPDMDQRSMELFQVGMQLAQARSGISAASQGDLSSVPENNTATGVRAIMSRAAVLLKKPIRRMRRSKGRAFSYAVKLHYGNFDRVEAFAWGEGADKELITITPEQVQNLDIDVVMSMTQEQNQDKLQAAQAAMQVVQAYAALPPRSQLGGKIVGVQSLKALEIKNAEDCLPDAVLTFQDCISALPPEQQGLAQQFLASLQQQQAPESPISEPTTPPTQ
jgi:hypothetical protein